MKIKNDPICNLCGLEIDTYSHAFFNCNIVYAFWKNIEEWIYEKTNVQLQLTVSDIILGRSGQQNDALNIIISICKMYLFSCSRENKRISMYEIRAKINNYFITEKKIYFSNSNMIKFKKRWQKFYMMFEY